MAQTRPPGLERSATAHPFESKLSQQLQPESSSMKDPVSRSPKSRSLSDASKPTTSPGTQPSTGDLSRPPSKDDSALPTLPATPNRSTFHHPNLSLNLPSKASPSPISRVPLSPKLDSSQIYGSPGSVLPRRSRGLDFSRACTNLHHSTLAESSPDSSPTIGGRGMTIPQRRGSLGSTSVPPLSTSGPADRTAISSSVSSVNMMESDTSSSEDDDEDMGDRDDVMLNTPQATRMSGPSPFTTHNMQSPGSEWMGGYSQAAASLMSFQRARFRKGRSRHSSSSASGNSSKPSPGPHSPPVLKSVENPTGGYFGPRHSISSRRESLSLGTRDLRLSDMSDDGESRAIRAGSPTGPASHAEGGPLGVIRRAVTRRGSLLPKTKTFARIRAALMEEGKPADSDIQREAEVIRQVRDTEPETSPTLSAFPSLQPPEPLSTSPESEFIAPKSLPSTSSFSKQASRNSGGVEFWNSFDDRYRTPPPARQAASSAPDDDILMDMTPSHIGSNTADSKSRSRSSTPHAGMSVVNEMCRKRRREDDFDPNLFKRRAVSPSVSAQSSPVLTHTSTVIDNGPNIWGPPSKLGPPFAERPNTESGNRTTPHNGPHTGTPKRVGLQGMTEASDGFMNMSIE